ncbi:M23 family metallopeptidase [Leptodesmis sp.]|uniref:M23 family metallopeptidase n=1 Tax=Leptodesmis sp. TaxID=3100501 RepID=UPI0040534F21
MVGRYILLYGDRRLHAGEDLGAPEGMPVLAAHSGYVRYADWGDGYGKMIILEYADGQYQTLYAHLSEILVKPGEAVRARQVIGKVGSTGGVTGPHLHLEILKKEGSNFQAIDPAAQLKAAASYVTVKPPEPGRSAISSAPEDAPASTTTLPSSNGSSQPLLDSSEPPVADIRAATGRASAVAEYPTFASGTAAGSRPRDQISLNFDPSIFGN